MARVALETSRVAPRATLNHLGHEIVQAETKANLWGRQGIWDRYDWWDEYLTRLRTWHWYWVRHQLPRLTRCPDCMHIQDPAPGLCRCFACGSEWLVHG